MNICNIYLSMYYLYISYKGNQYSFLAYKENGFIETSLIWDLFSIIKIGQQESFHNWSPIILLFQIWNISNQPLQHANIGNTSGVLLAITVIVCGVSNVKMDLKSGNKNKSIRSMLTFIIILTMQ